MKENKVREPRRHVTKGDVIIPKSGVWAGDECLVLDVEKRVQPYGYYLAVHVLLPNQRRRWYCLAEIKEIIPGRRAILTKARRRKSDVRVPNDKLSMRVVLEPVSGTAKDNLERAKLEIERVLAFRGSVTSVKTNGTRIIVEFEINPKWDLPMPEKVKSLKEWIPAKVKVVFKVLSVSAREYE
jgi:hypothetical protein